MSTKPTYEQGKLHLEIYEMRREARLETDRLQDSILGRGLGRRHADDPRIVGPMSQAGSRCGTASISTGRSRRGRLSSNARV